MTLILFMVDLHLLVAILQFLHEFGTVGMHCFLDRHRACFCCFADKSHPSPPGEEDIVT